MRVVGVGARRQETGVETLVDHHQLCNEERPHTSLKLSDLARYGFAGAGWHEGHSQFRSRHGHRSLRAGCCKTLLYRRAAKRKEPRLYDWFLLA